MSGIADTLLQLLMVIAILGTAFVNFRSSKYQSQMRESDVVMRCQDKYNRLVFEHKRHAVRNSELFYTWNRYYWGLQADQFLYWKRGWISDELILHWLEHRFNQFRTGDTDTVDGKEFSYTDRWQLARSYTKDKQFVLLMDGICNEANPGSNYDYTSMKKKLKMVNRRF